MSQFILQAAIFDLDGLLIDSEPLWQQAEIDVFGSLGIDLTIEMCHQTHGMRIDRVVEYWYERKPWQGSSHTQVGDQIIDRFLELLDERVVERPGATRLVQQFAERNIPIGIASSSVLRIIEAAVKKLEIGSHIEVLHSAEFEEHGKPDPAVYLTAAEKMNVLPAAVIAFEDSAVGVEAAVSAGMKCVLVPDQVAPDDHTKQRASLVLSSLEEFSFESIDALFQ